MFKYIPRLEEIREGQGRMITWVATQLGVSRASVSHWESGETMIPYDKARMLAKIYGVTMEELYEEENQPE